MRPRRLPRLTDRQKRVVAYIGTFLSSEGRAPTLTEIRDHLGLSAVSTVHEHIENLIIKGYLTRDWNGRRSIELTRRAIARGAARVVSLAGSLKNGGLTIADERCRDEVAVPRALAGAGNVTAIRVIGDSLVGEGICDGDTLIIEQTSAPRSGAMVLVKVRRRGVLIRRFFRSGESVRLVAPNKRGRPIKTRAAEVDIVSVVVGLQRQYR
ncbi:MAG: transcriptional repressor LexA [Candidatus Krumholzibacteria bacterium]|nr:transcriptional repressor LexA [Candidatus Krumholzibacteria bacterium]